jgi:Tfp pilus assembly protein PilF
LEHAEPGDDQLALEQFAKAVELDPNHEDAYEDRAKLYRRLGQTALTQRDAEMLCALRKQSAT